MVGTWYVLAHEGVVPIPEGGNGSTRVFQELGVGVLPVDVEFKEDKPERVVMTQGKFEILSDVDDGEEQANIARALGLAREDLDESLPIQAVSSGPDRQRNRMLEPGPTDPGTVPQIYRI